MTQNDFFALINSVLGFVSAYFAVAAFLKKKRDRSNDYSKRARGGIMSAGVALFIGAPLAARYVFNSIWLGVAISVFIFCLCMGYYLKITRNVRKKNQ